MRTPLYPISRAAGAGGLLAGLLLAGCATLGPSSSFQPPQTIESPSVDAPSLESWRALDKSTLPRLLMGQRWLGAAGEISGEVQVAHDGSQLLVYAKLPDRDIFNPVEGFNQESWNRGDIFEIFLRPVGQESYFEFHVSPRNQRFQLRFSKSEESGEDYEKTPSTIDVESSVSLQPDNGCWLVFASIPLHSLLEKDNYPMPVRWRVSFARYDYTRGPNFDHPALFSTSPHRKLSYHRQHEWATLILK